jgi:hypothetical protein
LFLVKNQTSWFETTVFNLNSHVMKKNVFRIAALLVALLFINQSYAQDRSPAGERSGREGNAGDRGGSDGGKDKQAAAKKDQGRATYEKERTDATSGEADYNRGMNNDRIGGTPAGSRDAGTTSARAGADVKDSERDAAGPDNSDRGTNKEGLAGPHDTGIKKAVAQVDGSPGPTVCRATPVAVNDKPVNAPKPKPQAPKKPKPERERADRF